MKGRGPLRSFLGAVAAAALLAGCASAPTPRFASGEEAALTDLGLRPVERAGFQRVWVRPGVSFREYDGIWLRYRDIAYRRPPGPSHGPIYGIGGDNYSLSDDLYARLTEAVHEIFEDELIGAGLRPVEGKGPGVLDARAGLIELVVHVPLDVRGGQDNIYVDSVASVTILVDLHDSVSGELIARVAERAGIASLTGRPIRATAASAIYETRRLLRGWASRLRVLLQAMKTVDLS
jgi:hypothetical protein